MPSVITRRTEVDQAHRHFHNILNRSFTEQIACRVGYPSGSFEDNVHYSPSLDIWISVRSYDSRHWNGFGIGRPVPGRSNTVRSEINFPYETIARRISGVFAQEDDGNILILHRGRLGGNTGINRQFVLKNYRGGFVTAQDGARPAEFLFVGELASPNLPQQIATFAREVDRIKHLYTSEPNDRFSFLDNFRFTGETTGTSTVPGLGPRIIHRRHGIIVTALSDELRVHHSLKTANTRNIDLFIHRNRVIDLVFEIKTETNTQSLATALGQLLLYTIPIRNQVRLVMVLPEQISREVAHRFADYNIIPLYYNWNEGQPIFDHLPALLRFCSLIN